MNKVKTIYISCPLRLNGQAAYITKHLRNRGFVVHNPCEWGIKYDAPENISEEVYTACLNAMENSEVCILVENYGIDCAWEAGWFIGKGLPVVQLTKSDVLSKKDWMVKHGISSYIGEIDDF